MNPAWFSLPLLVVYALGADDAARVIVKVNGTAITAGDIELAATSRDIKPEERAVREPQLVEELIDRQIVRDFLAKRKVVPPADELAQQMKVAEDAIKKGGDDLAKLLAKVGYTPEKMKAELSTPLAWRVYARQTVTGPDQKDYFEQHRSEFDGTQLRARQIFLKLSANPSAADIAMKKSQLDDVKSQVVTGKLSFQDAAKKYSEAPTRDQGGDVGVFGFRGQLPSPVIRAAFDLKVNDISEPVVSAFGVHLIQVTERIPGDLSLEDVRPEIMERLSSQLWNDTITRERKTAKIERAK